MNKRYAISDIHGNYRTFLRALEAIQLSPNDELFLLGDYVDKGPNSRKLINHILQLEQDGYQVNCLLGNHEVYMLNGMEIQEDPSYFTNWLRAGGRTTLPNYLLDEEAKLLHADIQVHLEWMKERPVLIETEDYLLVHAGFNFRSPDPFKDTAAMLQIRNWYDDINLGWLGDRCIVHGHTPMRKDAILSQQNSQQHKLPVFNIDGGCFYEGEGFGHLAIFDLDQRSFQTVPNMDMPLEAIRARKKTA